MPRLLPMPNRSHPCHETPPQRKLLTMDYRMVHPLIRHNSLAPGLLTCHHKQSIRDVLGKHIVVGLRVYLRSLILCSARANHV